MSAMHCPNCHQQVAPGVRCWSCGTVTPRSMTSALANVGACLLPVVFCLFFGALGVLQAEWEREKREKERELEREANKAEARKVAAEHDRKVEQQRAAANRPPRIPPKAIRLPTWIMTHSQGEAGVAFFASGAGERPVVLTVLHLLSRKDSDAMVTGAMAPKVLKELRLRSISKQPSFLLAGDVIPLPDASPDGTGIGDVLALRGPEGANPPSLPLTEAPPPRGTRVWLAAPLPGKPELLHPARSGGLFKGQLYYDFEDKGLELGPARGAPILNAQGQVVGIHFTGGRNRGRLIGVATPVSRFLPALKRALADNEPKDRK